MELQLVSDADLLARLASLCLDGHRLTAKILVYLGEVEARSLHLRAACSSLYDFCTRRLGMSEGAAYRRVAASRVVRRFPQVLPHVEKGEVHVSALARLQRHFDESNVDSLMAKIIRRPQREVEALAARLEGKRKPPMRTRIVPLGVAAVPFVLHPPNGVTTSHPCLAPTSAPGAASSDALANGLASSSSIEEPTSTAARSRGIADRTDGGASHEAPIDRAQCVLDVGARRTSGAPSTGGESTSGIADDDAASTADGSAAAHASTEGRHTAFGLVYRVHLTASARLHAKLEYARSLTRHRNLRGDMAVVIEQAIDLLIAKLEREIHGRPPRPTVAATTGATKESARAPDVSTADRAASSVATSLDAGGIVTNGGGAAASSAQPSDCIAPDTASAVGLPPPTVKAAKRVPKKARTRKVPAATRRYVFARDGLQCTFTDEAGNRCPARELLEIDHIEPFARGGGHGASNLRVRCRAHNGLHAEDCYGRSHVQRSIDLRRRKSTTRKAADEPRRGVPRGRASSR